MSCLKDKIKKDIQGLAKITNNCDLVWLYFQAVLLALSAVAVLVAIGIHIYLLCGHY